jgi:hypothetical protein
MKEELLKHINDQADYWIDLYNKSPINDRGESVSEFAKGSYMAYLELKNYIEHEEKREL